MTLWQKLTIMLGSILALVGSWFAGKRAGAANKAKAIALEQQVGQVNVLKEDVAIDAQADEAKREIENQAVPDGTILNMQAFIERNKK